MKSIADVEPYVIASSMLAADAHPSVLQANIRESIIDFLEQSRVATEEMYFTSQCGVADYLLEAQKCHRMLAVEKVAYKKLDAGNCCDPSCTQHEVYDRTWQALRPMSSFARDNDALVLNGYEIDIHSSPNTAIKLSSNIGNARIYVSYTYTITRDDCGVEDWIIDQWLQAIVAGTNMRLASRVGANNAIARAEFNGYVTAARVRKARAYTNGKVTLRTDSFMPRARRW